MLDPLATFLLRVLEAGNDVDPGTALFGAGDTVSDDRRAMADQLTRRARDGGYVEDTAEGRISVTPDGRRYLDDRDL